MAVSFNIDGNPRGPLLVCVHGLMGGPEDFNEICVPLKEHFQVAVVDMNAQTKDRNLLSKVDHDNSARDIADFLKKEFAQQKPYFLGISFGGKVIYDYIEHSSDNFAGAVITDAGPGVIQKSDFYNFITVVLPSINKSLPWPKLRDELKEKVPIRNLRSLIAQKLHYPNGPDQPAQWRSGLLELPELLVGQRIRDQWASVEKATAPIKVLVASENSLIASDDLAKMESSAHFVLKKIPNSTHFLHVSHHDDIRRACLEFLQPQSILGHTSSKEKGHSA